MIHPLRGEPCILAVCRDHRLRIWSCKVGRILFLPDMDSKSSEGIISLNSC